MILPGEKGSSLNPVGEEGENLARKRRTRSINRSDAAGSKKTKAESSKTSPLTPLDVGLKNYFGNVLEDPQIKLKLLQLIPRNPAQETSEGVQEFIKVMSNFIEQKNPFKETLKGATTGEKRRLPRQPAKADEIRQVTKSSDQKTKNSLREGLKSGEKTQKLNSGPTKKPRVLIKKDENDEKTQKKGRSKGDEVKPNTKGTIIPKVEDVTPKREDPPPKVEKMSEEQENKPVIEQPPRKAPRPSEIPLMKTRHKKAKPVSLLLRKAWKENASAASIECYQVKKTFSPIEECSMEAELHIIVTPNDGQAEDTPEKTNSEEMTLTADEDLLKLERHSKSPNIPLSQQLSAQDLTEMSVGGCRSKVLDLDKVRSSSLTLLTSRGETLQRLESLHKQNVSAKEEKCSAQSEKLKALIPKISFGNLKGKGLKKNLSARPSSKGNKPGLKAKKPETPTKTPPTSAKRTPHLDIYKKIIAAGKVGDLCLDPNSPVEEPKPKRAPSNFPRIKSPRNKSFEEEKDTESTKPRISGLEKAEKLYKSKVAASNMASYITRRAELRQLSLRKKTSSPEEAESTLSSDIETDLVLPSTPPPTPEEYIQPRRDIQQMTEFEEPLKTDGKYIAEKPPVPGKDFRTMKVKNKTTGREKEAMNCESFENICIQGKGLNLTKEEDFGGSETEKVKLEIKIDMSAEEEEYTRLIPDYTPDWFFDDYRQYDRNDAMIASPHITNVDSVSMKLGEARMKSDLRKSCRSSSSLKRRIKCKMSTMNVLMMAKNKSMRSDAGDRWLPKSAGSIKSGRTPPDKGHKGKTDTKVRSGLTQSHGPKVSRERRDPFEEATALKLRRRNSEPYSGKGFVWKHADAATPRGAKASVSSMASSLRHLNTDDLDDFIFWEAVPQKVTACWEMSLYHFKRPWSVLSCSVFDDNRQSSTPGLILDNLRNGGTPITRRCIPNQTERIDSRKDNAFDIEPSIAQKNIDIRNWLAALNFSSPPSTSTDAINEGNFGSQPSIQDLTKTQVSSKRRKVLTRLKFSDEIIDRNGDENGHKESEKWRTDEVGDLMELIRRKSGGFVTTQQFFHERQKTPLETSTWTNSSEDKSVAPCRNESSSVITFKDIDTPSQPEEAMEDPPATPKEEKQSGEAVTAMPGSLPGQDPGILSADINIWKYLFLSTLFIIVIYISWDCNNLY